KHRDDRGASRRPVQLKSQNPSGSRTNPFRHRIARADAETGRRRPRWAIAERQIELTRRRRTFERALPDAEPGRLGFQLSDQSLADAAKARIRRDIVEHD